MLILIRIHNKLPAAFIVTGPNIASQSHLFGQLSTTIQDQAVGPIVILRSGDASNLKAALKKIIKEATHQAIEDDEEDVLSEQNVSQSRSATFHVLMVARVENISTTTWRFYTTI